MPALMMALLMVGVAGDPAPADGAKKTAKDPNEIVCEKSQELGSRLAVKRVCMTRAEWADRRLQDRQTIDKAQTERGTVGK